MSCSEWKDYELGCLCEYRKDKISIEQVSINNYVSTENMIQNKGGIDVASGIPNSKQVNKYIEGDILISNIRPYFKKIWYATQSGGNSSDVLVFKNKFNGKLDNTFLYYMLSSDNFFDYVMSTAKGTKMPRGDKDAIMKYKLNLPTLEEQQKIANILSSLDDKIELNNEMNKTLEEMAQSIFKRWFVDFEFPNKDGEPYKSSGGEMVDSELGIIPKGWKVKSIGDIGNVITGKTPSAKVEGSYGDECNFITPRDITSSPIIIDTERKLSSIGINNLKKNLVCKNSIGVSCIGSNLGEVYITGENSITNQQINTLVLKEGKIYPYVYIYLKNMKDEFLNMAGGSAVPIINKTSFSGINILMPDMYILNKFIQSTTCYFERIEENLKENESLIALRDSLLPKLMSGEIKAN